MLKGVPSIISPELLKTLAEMGHGDEIVICDANCPAMRINNKVIRCDGKNGPEIAEAILKLMPLDTYEQPVYLMGKVKGDENVKTPNWDEYEEVVKKHTDKKIDYLGRFEFYDRAANAYAIVISSDLRPYGNIILKKGVLNEEQ